MRKTIALFSILFVLTVFVSPSFAQNDSEIYVEKVEHNVNRLTTTFKQFNNIDMSSINNFQTKISLAIVIGKMTEAIKSGKTIDSRGAESFHKTYYSMLDSFDKGLDDLTTAVRHENSKSTLKAQKHFKRGLVKLSKIRKAIKSKTNI